MVCTMIIGAVFFALSALLGLLVLCGALFKNIGATHFGILGTLFFLLFPCFCFGMQVTLYLTAPHVWGLAWFFIVLNVYFLVLQYIHLVGSAVFTRSSIYRLTRFLVWKRHSYDDVIGYVMKKSSGVIWRRFGSRKVVTFDVEIYFTGDQYASFSTKDRSNRKVEYITKMLEDHHCRRNGRIKGKRGSL